jgi:hypothetical protein
MGSFSEEYICFLQKNPGMGPLSPPVWLFVW